MGVLPQTDMEPFWKVDEVEEKARPQPPEMSKLETEETVGDDDSDDENEN